MPDTVARFVTAALDLAYALAHPRLWLDWSDPVTLVRFIHHGALGELLLFVLTAIGLWCRAVIWGAAQRLEGFSNATGRVVA